MSFVTPYDSLESSRFVPELHSRFHGLILFDILFDTIDIFDLVDYRTY